MTRQTVGCWPAWRVSAALLPTLMIHSKWICTDCKCLWLLNIFVYSCRPQSAANYSYFAECCRNSTSPYQPCDQAVKPSPHNNNVRLVERLKHMNVLNTNFLVDSYVQNSKESLMLLPFTVIQKGCVKFYKKICQCLYIGWFSKLEESLEQHEKSECHKEALLKLTIMQGLITIT